jgi:hypothetical protein
MFRKWPRRDSPRTSLPASPKRQKIELAGRPGTPDEIAEAIVFLATIAPVLFMAQHSRWTEGAVPFERLKHFRLAVEPGGPIRLGRSWGNDLRRALAVVTAHGKGVVPMLEEPLITPDDPG